MIEVLLRGESSTDFILLCWWQVDCSQTEVCATRRRGDESDRFDSYSGFKRRDSRRVATPPRFRVFGARLVGRRHALISAGPDRLKRRILHV